MRVLVGVISIGELTFLSSDLNRFRNNLQSFFSRITRISESALYLQDYFDFIDLEMEQTDDEKIPLPEVIRDGFVVRNVHFTYPGSNEEVLKGVSFKLEAGGKMAFVGDRKSTRLNSSHVAISYAVFCLKKKISSDAASN